MKVGVVYERRFLEYETEPLSPEGPDRISLLYKELEKKQWLEHIKPRPATTDELSLVHDISYIEKVKELSKKGGRLSEDTWISKYGFEVASLAVGGVLEAVDSIMKGRLKRAFAFVRPPGHHAGKESGMGFCIFNNIAIGACYAIKRFGLKRIMIVDWDVHHGNGTQEIFYSSQDVLYFSIHQYPFFPDTGYFDEIGEGAGKGYTVNVPLTVGCGDTDYANVFRHILVPLIEKFSPELIMVSAGFDAHHLDPLGEMYLTEEGFGRLAGILLKASKSVCDGRIVFVLEGGHHPEAVYRSSFEVLRTCYKEDYFEDMEKKEDESYYKIRPFIDTVRQSIKEFWKI